MIKKHLKIALISFLLLPNVTYAICSENDKADFESVKEEYKVTYTYDYDKNTYDIRFPNKYPNKYKYVLKYINEFDHQMEKNITTTITYKDLKPNKYTIQVVGITKTCNEVLNETTIELKKKNKYANDELCKGMEDFALCDEYYDKDIDYDTFVSRLNTYKKTLEKETKESNDTINKKNSFLEYVENNLLQIIVISVFTISVIATIIITYRIAKKSRRLE